MSDLYDTDIFAWSEQQAERLRQVAVNDRLNNASLDWPNIIEEIEDVGRSQLDAIESLLTQAFLHMLKAAAWPLSLSEPSWQADARLFRRQAKRKFRESMRQKIDVVALYADALAGLPDKMVGQPPLPVPQVCTVTLNELLGDA